MRNYSLQGIKNRTIVSKDIEFSQLYYEINTTIEKSAIKIVVTTQVFLPQGSQGFEKKT